MTRRRRPPRRRRHPVPQASARLYVRLLPRNVSLLTFLLQAEDNLALPTVVDRFAAVVRLVYCPDEADRVEAFLRDLAVMCPETTVCLRPESAFPVARSPGDE
ncbi:MAG: DUF4911 domain-containing protein [Acidobacteriota bacterium]